MKDLCLFHLVLPCGHTISDTCLTLTTGPVPRRLTYPPSSMHGIRVVGRIGTATLSRVPPFGGCLSARIGRLLRWNLLVTITQSTRTQDEIGNTPSILLGHPSAELVEKYEGHLRHI